jgi:YidC/Oxa1 family membrane protein insertase
MRELQPKMEAIKEKFKDNPQKQQEAMMKMYKETGVNPLGGCLPMLMQYPIIIALWQFLPAGHRDASEELPLGESDLSAPDIILICRSRSLLRQLRCRLHAADGTSRWLCR